MSSRKDRQAVAQFILSAVGAHLEMFAEKPDCGYFDDIKHLTSDGVGEIVADLLKRLPGDSWDTRIPEPARKVR